MNGKVSVGAENLSFGEGVIDPAISVRFGEAVMLGIVVEYDGVRSFMWAVPRPDWPGKWDSDKKFSTVDHLLAAMPIKVNQGVTFQVGLQIGPKEDQNTDFTRKIFALPSQQGQGDDVLKYASGDKEAGNRLKYKIFIFDNAQ